MKKMEANTRTFTDIPITRIQTYLSNNSKPFESSQLYSAQRDEKFIDEDLRKSTFRTIHDSDFFDLIDSTIIQPILNDNEKNKAHYFMLRRNDVTHIKYSEGGFFKRHRDYLSTTSNFVEEFTFLLCVTPTGDEKKITVEGGETKLFGYGESKVFDTSTPGTGLLFRKDLEHEGCELLKGEKHIITLNLFATRKELSDQVLLVTFPNQYKAEVGEVEGDSNDKEKKMKSLLHIASNESLSYAIPAQNLFGMLEAHVRFTNRQHVERCDQKNPPIIHYECKNFDFETFGVLVKIFNNAYVQEEDLVKAKECMDYYGPFSTNSILVNLSLSPDIKDNEKRDKTNDQNIEDDGKNEQNTKLKYKDLMCDKNIDPDIIVCENEARMKAVAKVAQMLGEPFVPFKIAFVEGVLCNTHQDVFSVPMTAAACLLGDYNNIFSMWKLSQLFLGGGAIPLPLDRVHLENNFFSRIVKDEQSLTPGTTNYSLASYINDDTWETWEEMKSSGFGFGLKIGFEKNHDVKGDIAKSLFTDEYSILHSSYKSEREVIYLPGLDNSQDKSNMGVIDPESDITGTIASLDNDPCDCMLVRADPSINIDKFYVLQLIQSDDNESEPFVVYSRYGFTGTTGRVYMQVFDDRSKAIQCFANKFEEWENRSYNSVRGKHRFIKQNYAEKKGGYRGANWQYWVDDGIDGKTSGWYDYDTKGSRNVEQLYQEYLKNPMLTTRLVESGCWTYNIDLVAMKQTNVKDTNRTSRFIRRYTGEKMDDNAPPSTPSVTASAVDLAPAPTIDLATEDSKYYHLNKEGFVTFTREEAERTSNYISSIDFEARVKNQLQQKRFELPQEFDKVDAMFCNEAVYGKANILWVCGVIRLDNTSGKKPFGEATADFDVWPSCEAKRMMKRQADSYRRVFEGEDGEWSDIMSKENEVEDEVL